MNAVTRRRASAFVTLLMVPILALAGFLDSTSNSAVGISAKKCTVPTGVVSGTILIMALSVDATIDVDSGHYPAGFTELAETDLSFGGETETVTVSWKRATGADTGTYDFSVAGGTNWICQVVALDGRHATNPPTISASNANNGANGSPVTVTANGVTAVGGDDLVYFSLPDVNASGVGNGHSPPTSPTAWTEQEDAEDTFVNMELATLLNVSAGATGNVSSTFSMTSGTASYESFVVRVPAAAAASSALLRRRRATH